MAPKDDIDTYIANLTDWRGDMVTYLRSVIHDTDDSLVEEWKWSTPVFSKNGMVCALGVFKDHIKINFFKGASLPDLDKLFNSGLDAKNSRSIDLREGNTVDESKLKNLIKSAINLNTK